MNVEEILLEAFRAMDDVRKEAMLMGMQALARDFPAQRPSNLRLASSTGTQRDKAAKSSQKRAGITLVR